MQHRVTSIAVGREHFVALTGEGLVFTWGGNTHGQLGLDRPAPAPVPAPTEVTSLRGKSIVKVCFGMLGVCVHPHCMHCYWHWHFSQLFVCLVANFLNSGGDDGDGGGNVGWISAHCLRPSLFSCGMLQRRDIIDAFEDTHAFALRSIFIEYYVQMVFLFHWLAFRSPAVAMSPRFSVKMAFSKYRPSYASTHSHIHFSIHLTHTCVHLSPRLYFIHPSTHPFIHPSLFLILGI